MEKSIWVLLAFVAGALLPLQAGMNAKLGKELQNPAWATIVSFIVGLLAMLAYAAITRQKMNLSGFGHIEVKDLLGGVLGAFYVTVMVLAYPRIGAALSFGLVVAGQVTVSLLLDHYKIMVEVQHSINIYRVIALLLIVTGVVMFRKF